MSDGSVSQRFRMALNREEGMKSLDKVVLDYGYVEGEKFSFKDHEYQIEIMRDTSSRMGVRKCSQVGLSELMVQKGIAICAVQKNIRIMFSLPTKEMAMGFSKDRFDGAIQASDYYRGLVAAGENSAGMKKIGSSFLYVIGTFGSKSAISVPAEIIMSDEVDFSNEVVLGKLNSRIRHAKSLDERGNRGYRYRFSTPTVEGYGIDIDFNAGDQRHYMCRCEHCEKWVLPDYIHDFIVPGFDKGMLEFSRDDVDDTRYAIEDAYIKCQSCGKDLFRSLCNPDRRQWVAKKPDVWDRSYQVSPWDVPVYNTPRNIVKQYSDYPLKSDFFNFVLGLPFSDADNTFLTTDEHRRRVCDVDLWIFNNCIVQQQTVGGMDVGKICHLTVRARVGPKMWHVVWMEKIHNTKLDPAVPQVLARYDFFRMKKMVIDSGPDITLVNLLVNARDGIQACTYTSVAGFIPIEEKKAGDVINADRTKTLTLLLNEHNSGDLHYPHRDDLRIELFKHLATTKKIREKGLDGVIKEKFIKSDKQDHWVHSLNYSGIAVMACEMLEDNSGVAALPNVSRVRVGSGVEDKERSTESVSPVLQGLFGFGGRKR